MLSLMYIRLNVKYLLFLSDCNQKRILQTDVRKILNIKFNKNPSSGRRVVPCGQTEKRTDITRITDAFFNLQRCLKTSYTLNNFGFKTTLQLKHTRVGTLIMAIIYLQLIQNRYMFRRFTVLQCSHQHCVQPVASDVEVVGYL